MSELIKWANARRGLDPHQVTPTPTLPIHCEIDCGNDCCARMFARTFHLARNACVEGIGYRADRALDRAEIASLAWRQWIDQGMNLIVVIAEIRQADISTLTVERTIKKFLRTPITPR
ncbi:MAG: hypothetical protein I8H77_10670 [Comamonadaceae bacterium]|nr:hypothetical protein [Comamonadaceae bacterium]